jgi:hypothetical protein
MGSGAQSSKPLKFSVVLALPKIISKKSAQLERKCEEESYVACCLSQTVTEVICLHNPGKSNFFCTTLGIRKGNSLKL